MSDTGNDTPLLQDETRRTHFIEDIIDGDLAGGKHTTVATRFPPEPNGYLHIGHAKSICLNFGLAKKYRGTCNLRFDDTNPTKEDVEYVDSIKEDVRWLGFSWDDREYFASDYFERLYEFAVELVKKGKAYVCNLTPEEVKEYRGNFYIPGKDSPYRNRSVEENLDLLERMRRGEFEDGSITLRAKIDMAHPNMNMRDPTVYRVRKVSHHRTGDKWCIYPMYDFTHGLSDALEGITHSICTLEFEDHRPLYDWFLDQVDIACHPQQIEFARLNLTYTVMSKRRLLELVQKKLVSGWDDPRMPTLVGMRRRGYPAAAIRNFCDKIGVAKADGIVDVALLEHSVREELNETTPRVMAVLDPIKVVITNLPEGHLEYFDAPYHPEKPEMGSRPVPFTRELFIEREDFRMDAPRKWFRLAPGQEVRLRYACLLKCDEAVLDEQGEVRELRCTMDPESRGGHSPDGRKVKGTLHWVSADHCVMGEVRLYDRLFLKENPMEAPEGGSYLDNMNPDSLSVGRCCMEPSLTSAKAGDSFQFERLGYFCVDPASGPEGLVFNKTVGLRDSWARIERSLGQPEVKAQPTAAEPKAAAAPRLEPIAETITIDDLARVDLRVGLVMTAELVKGADKLLRLEIDLGEGRLRQIFAGIRAAYPEPEVLVGRRVIVVANLLPRKMKFGLSEGMVLAGVSPEALGLSTVDKDLPPGTRLS